MSDPKGGGGGGFDLGQMMQQAQRLQEDMLKAKQEAEQQTVEASSGGGMVTITISGGMEVKRVKLDPAAVDPKDVGMLEDLIAAAFNQAVQKAQKLTAESMQKAMGPLAGMNIPGLF